jgi:hypothetical protein
MRRIALALAVIAVAALPGAGSAQDPGLGTCRVADPTGTPLNVRQGPQGRVVGSLRNGSIVRIAATARDHKGQVWTQVVAGDGRHSIGWVLRAYLSCH